MSEVLLGLQLLTVLEWLESLEEDLEGDVVLERALGVAHDHIDYVD